MVGKLSAAALAFALMAGALGACSSITDPGSPKSSFDADQDIKALSQAFGSATSISTYYASAETRSKRDAFVTGRLALINLDYIQFIKAFAADTAQLDSAFDLSKLGVDLATTLVPGAGTKSILGAISGGLTGSRTSIDKNFFQEKTVPVLISEMNAQRKVALAPIIAGLSQDIDKYPLSTALVDLQTYYEAGTFAGALQSIQKDAGSKESNADIKLDKLRKIVYAADASSERITKFLFPSGPKQPPNNANVAALKKWLAANSLDQVPISTFLDDGDFADQRKQAIADLSIP